MENGGRWNADCALADCALADCRAARFILFIRPRGARNVHWVIRIVPVLPFAFRVYPVDRIDIQDCSLRAAVQAGQTHLAIYVLPTHLLIHLDVVNRAGAAA